MRAGNVTGDQDALRFPFEEAPPTGVPVEVAPGIL
ncbi:hypothetical protein ACSSVZ_005670 [Amorphus sp. MBR-141]